MAVTKGRLTRSILIGVSMTVCGNAHARTNMSSQTTRYVEDGLGINVISHELSASADINPNFTIDVGFGLDAVSGATATWCHNASAATGFAPCRSKLPNKMRRSSHVATTLRDTERNGYRFGVSSSNENDYVSRNLSASALIWSDDRHNRSYQIGLGLQEDEHIASKWTNFSENQRSKVLKVDLGVDQVIDANDIASIALFTQHSMGWLGNDYQKIVRQNASEWAQAPESRPSERKAFGVTASWFRQIKADLVSRLNWRWYQDDWGVAGHTVQAQVWWNVNEHWKLGPSLRWMFQRGAFFYRSYADNTWFPDVGYGVNDARLGPLRTLAGDVTLGYQHDNKFSAWLTLGRYYKSSDLGATWLATGIRFTI